MTRNMLDRETSPYLLQHKDNPVHWQPWGAAAFEAAKQADKPILLSIGYTACHWCHQMQRESFMDPTTAAFMNCRSKDELWPTRIARLQPCRLTSLRTS